MQKASLSRNLLAHALLTAAFTAVLWVLLAIPLSADERMMKDTDLRGSDFTSLIARNEFTCLQACTANEQCRAWTFVARGSKCFLKNAVPAPAYCSFCVSGVVQVEDAAPAPTPPAPPPAETPPPPPPDATPPPPGPPALMTCRIQQPLGVCPTASACGEGTGVAPIGELEAIGTVTICRCRALGMRW